MKYSTMERLGASPSLLGFGCMRFPTTPEGKIDRPRAQAMIDRAYESGVRYFDTAYPYHAGESEPFVGEALKKYDRKSLYIATKLPMWKIESAQQAKEVFEEQLAHLQTDYIDFYLFHALAQDRWDKMLEQELIPIFEQYQREGKIRHLGFSFHDSYEVFERIATYRQWDFCQLQLNYMDTDEQAGLRGYALCEQLNMPVVVMEPIKGGSLATLPEDIEAALKAMRPDMSVASWALRYVGSLPNVKVILSGMSTEEQVEDNLKTFADFESLSPAELRAVGDAVRTIRSRIKNGCTGCRYCMPCPFGVDIPRNFSVWNEYGMYGVKDRAKHRYADISVDARADQCRKCGKCEKECPQHLPIREHLDAVAKELGAL